MKREIRPAPYSSKKYHCSTFLLSSSPTSAGVKVMRRRTPTQGVWGFCFQYPLAAMPISSVIRRDVRSLRGIERHRAKGEHLSASGNASPLEDRVGSQFLDRHTPCTILISRVPRGRRMVHDVVLQAEGSSLQGLDPGVHNPNSARWAGQHQAPRTHTYLPIAHRSPQQFLRGPP